MYDRSAYQLGPLVQSKGKPVIDAHSTTEHIYRFWKSTSESGVFAVMTLRDKKRKTRESSWAVGTVAVQNVILL
jgi:hypothetical protein